MTTALPLWAQLVIALLLVLSGLFVLLSALGLVLLKQYFVRMHPPALAYTLGSWSVALASVLFFSLTQSRLVLHPLLITVFLGITVPVTTLLLARVALFRRRVAGIEGTPPPLTQRGASAAGPESSPRPSR